MGTDREKSVRMKPPKKTNTPKEMKALKGKIKFLAY
jgi:hypothetical protein